MLFAGPKKVLGIIPAISCSINEDVYAKKAQNPSLDIIVLTEELVVYNSHYSSSFFKNRCEF